ncbi:hypothetical protein HYU17_00890 [Candidatus Woesearchaeota archaeon]|nr:hypothetical protein [Candidatus Woesearchaeota archaeon]
MRPETKRRVAAFFAGIAIVSFATVIGTLAFLKFGMFGVIRNVAITDAAFIAIYLLWIKLHKGYEAMYKSGIEFEEEK